MDVERTMQFILDSQARLEASAQRRDEQLATLTASVQKHDEQIGALSNLVGRLAEAEIRLAEQMQGSEARTAELMQGQQARLASLETKMAQFLERMDRYIQGMEGNGHKLQ
jgi:chromosome segregation ATPase